MGTIASLITTANQIQKLLDITVEDLNAKIAETGYKVIFRQANRGKCRVVEPFLAQGINRTDITLTDEDMPKLLAMNAGDIVKYLKS